MASLLKPIGLLGIGVGTLLQRRGYQRAGRAERTMASKDAIEMEFQADQAVALSKRAFAASQRAAQEEERKARFTSSRALALAAASGGGVDDPTIINLLSDIDAEGAYRASVAMYQGEEEARQYREEAHKLRRQAQYRREGGAYQAEAYGTQAAATLLGGAGQLALAFKYG